MASKNRMLTRDSDAAGMLELLLVIAVATILINRAFLAVTGYPRIEFGSFHIAHMLWGGLLMLISLVMLLYYWNPSVRRLAAFISGIGFGLFIDELGKFITSDNDYFFKPTIAIIYMIFITMYLLFRRMVESRPVSPREWEVNNAIRKELEGSSESRWVRVYNYLSSRARSIMVRILSVPRVIPAVMIVFVLKSLAQFTAILGWINPGWMPTENVSGLAIAGAFCSGAMVLVGLILLRSSSVKAVQWFKRAILVSIFVTQVFLFYQSQLTAIWGLFFDLIVYISIDYYLRNNQLDGESAD